MFIQNYFVLFTLVFALFQASRKYVRDRNIELFLVKKESGPFWPHLLKQKLKQHWLKVDFTKWKDEDDDSDVEGEDFQQVSWLPTHTSFSRGAVDEL